MYAFILRNSFNDISTPWSLSRHNLNLGRNDKHCHPATTWHAAMFSLWDQVLCLPISTPKPEKWHTGHWWSLSPHTLQDQRSHKSASSEKTLAPVKAQSPVEQPVPCISELLSKREEYCVKTYLASTILPSSFDHAKNHYCYATGNKFEQFQRTFSNNSKEPNFLSTLTTSTNPLQHFREEPSSLALVTLKALVYF